MSKRAIRLFALIVVIGLSFGSLQQVTRAQTAAANKEVVKLGYVPVLIYAPLYIGIERGYFAAEGIDVQLTPLQGGTDSVVQLAAGNFDAAVGGIGAGLLNAANKGLDFRIVAPMHTERHPLASPLVIAADRKDEIKSVKDLKGKKVAINATGAATEYWVYSALQKAGLSMSDITLTTIAFKDVPAALTARAVDAAILGEPLATLAKDQGTVSVLADDFIDGITVTYLYMGLPLIQNRPQVAQGFVTAYLRAIRDLQGDSWKSKDTASIIQKYTKTPADVVLRASHAYYDPDGNIPLADINALQTYFLTRGELEFKTPIDMTKYVDSSFMTKALADLGPFVAPTAAATMSAPVDATMAATAAQ